jgi:peptidoglycan/LPS O-acetylase OafA/YrhL
MTPLDWFLAAAHFLWILGLSIIVAAFSYHAWRAHEDLRPLMLQLRARSWIIACNAGLVLVGVAVAIMPRSERWFIRAIALLMAMAFAGAALRIWWRQERT